MWRAACRSGATASTISARLLVQLVDSSFLLRQSCGLEVQRETSGILRLLGGIWFGGKRERAKQSGGTEKTESEAPD